MAILTYPLNGVTYDAENAEVYNCTRTSGVFADEGHFPATITGRLEISIGPGLAWIQNEEFHGKAIYNPDTVALAIEEADAHLTRIDRIVLQFDKLMKQTTLVVKTGTPASKPVAPDITRSSYIYELGLYTVTVKYSTLSLSDGCIANTFMDEKVCGLMRDGVTRLPTQNLYDQWHAWFINLQGDTEQFEAQLQQWFYDAKQNFEGWEAETKQDFEEWFETVKDVLDADTAGRLQNEIDKLKENETLFQSEIDTLKESETSFQNAIDKLKERVAKLEKFHYQYFAVFSPDDYNVIFYGDTEVPEPEDIYKGRRAMYVFTGEGDVTPWSLMASLCRGVSFDDTFAGARPTDMERWFFGWSNLTSIDLTNLNTSDVTTMDSLFHECRKLTELDLSPLDTRNVTNMNRLFNGCSSLTTLDLSPLNTKNVTNMSRMLNNCSGLTSLDLSPLDTRKVTSMDQMIAGCSGLTSIDLSPLDTSNATELSGMFWGCRKLTSLDLSPLDTRNATSFNQMFRSCEGLTTLDLSPLDTRNVTSMFAFLDGCTGLKTINFGEINTSKVEDMPDMFEDCSGLTSLDLTMLDTGKVTDIRAMFKGCTALKTIYADDSKFVTTSIRSGDDMFQDCTSLVGGYGTQYDSEKVSYEMAHVDTAENPGYFTAKS